MDCPGSGKSSWPELVGATGKAAKKKIERENPQVHAIVLEEGSATTRDRRCDRVWSGLMNMVSSPGFLI
ncbi:hypothetical protein M0R45_027192 [Rubus argutus]|uniref:Uncharacterized protein n=1 Tax=Rubus argutus TaxID=59490 RepID=A0AAW1X1F2_RUBAR